MAYKKIFISHSSKDSAVIDSFVDNILKLACGYKSNQIIYTTRQATGVEPAEDIIAYMRKRISECDLFIEIISDNFKQSEVCLNEMGAAWILEKKILSILLPNISFGKIGWLTSFNKAIQINDSEGLDTLYDNLKTEDIPVADWNRYKNAFLNSCSKLKKTKSRENHIKRADISNQESLVVNPAISNDLQIFDTEFFVRAITEGEYQFQINLRLRANKNITIKQVWLANEKNFTGNYEEFDSIVLNSFVDYKLLDINKLSIKELATILENNYESHSTRLQDYTMVAESQISITFIGYLESGQYSDGYEDLTTSGWKLRMTYNVDGFMEVPLQFNIANFNVPGYFTR